MKKFTAISLFLVGGCLAANAQNSSPYVYDVYNYSQQKIIGTARIQGIGGTYASLGADASNIASNPAGLAFYNRSEISLTPMFANGTTTSNYIGVNSSLSNSKNSIGQFALVFSNKSPGTRKRRSAFGIGYTRLIDFATDFNYAGDNNKSSMMDAFAERANNRGASTATLDDEFDTNTGLASSSESLYYQAYMIDYVNGVGYVPSDLSIPVVQDGRYTETGGASQWNLSYGVNYDDRTYFGASLGIKSLNYQRLTDHSERFPNGEVFNSFDYYDQLNVYAGGVNLSLGAIIKATENLQLGVNVTTPTALATSETYVEGLSISQKPNTFVTNFPKIETDPSQYSIKLTTPLRADVGATVFLPKKLGFLVANLGYVGYKGMNIKDRDNASWSSDQRTNIQEVYKSTLNWKVGSELRFGKARVRGGINYLASPYKQPDNTINYSQFLYTFGGGFRSERFYLDAAVVYNKYEGSYTPYTLYDAANYASAAYTTKRTNLVLSIGAFF